MLILVDNRRGGSYNQNHLPVWMGKSIQILQTAECRQGTTEQLRSSWKTTLSHILCTFYRSKMMKSNDSHFTVVNLRARDAMTPYF